MARPPSLELPVQGVTDRGEGDGGGPFCLAVEERCLLRDHTQAPFSGPSAFLQGAGPFSGTTSEEPDDVVLA